MGRQLSHKIDATRRLARPCCVGEIVASLRVELVRAVEPLPIRSPAIFALAWLRCRPK